MVDVVDRQTRSRYMAAVKSRGNGSTEKTLAEILHKKEIKGWRRHYPVVGTPDFCWRKEKVAVFVDGCFWHGCPNCYQTPKSNVHFWREKIRNNRRRDRRANAELRRKGWAVIRVWECKVKNKRTVSRIVGILRRRRWRDH